jgi:hypothetical protein
LHASNESDNIGLSVVLRGEGKPFVSRERFFAIDLIEELEGITAAGPPVNPLAKWGIATPTITFTSHVNKSGSRSTGVPIVVFPISVKEF